MISGIYYDSNCERVYVGGGYKTENKVTYYDIIKNKWIDLPNTSYEHSEYPAIWCNKSPLINNILYITGLVIIFVNICNIYLFVKNELILNIQGTLVVI